MTVTPSLGGVFDEIRFCHELHSLFGWPLWCCICKKNVEAVDHLLLHCETTYALWSSIFGLYGLK
jgi:hypothetical protein